MNLITPPTQEEQDKALLNAAAAEVGIAGNHLAATLADVFKRIFSLPREDLLRILNENKEQVAALLEAAGTFAAVLNPHLTALASSLSIAEARRFSARVPTGIPRADIAFDEGEGEWIAVDPEPPDEGPEE